MLWRFSKVSSLWRSVLKGELTFALTFDCINQQKIEEGETQVSVTTLLVQGFRITYPSVPFDDSAVTVLYWYKSKPNNGFETEKMKKKRRMGIESCVVVMEILKSQLSTRFTKIYYRK